MSDADLCEPREIHTARIDHDEGQGHPAGGPGQKERPGSRWKIEGGLYDVVAIWEFPNNQAAMKAALLNASMGHIEIKTMPAVKRDEWKKIVRATLGKKN